MITKDFKTLKCGSLYHCVLRLNCKKKKNNDEKEENVEEEEKHLNLLYHNLEMPVSGKKDELIALEKLTVLVLKEKLELA